MNLATFKHIHVVPSYSRASSAQERGFRPSAPPGSAVPIGGADPPERIAPRRRSLSARALRKMGQVGVMHDPLFLFTFQWRFSGSDESRDLTVPRRCFTAATKPAGLEIRKATRPM